MGIRHARGRTGFTTFLHQPAYLVAEREYVLDLTALDVDLRHSIVLLCRNARMSCLGRGRNMENGVVGVVDERVEPSAGETSLPCHSSWGIGDSALSIWLLFAFPGGT